MKGAKTAVGAKMDVGNPTAIKPIVSCNETQHGSWFLKDEMFMSTYWRSRVGYVGPPAPTNETPVRQRYEAIQHTNVICCQNGIRTSGHRSVPDAESIHPSKKLFETAGFGLVWSPWRFFHAC